MTAPRPTPEVIEQAAFWAAQLATDEATQEDRDACEAWCRQHPMHRLALERMRDLEVRMDEADRPGRETIEHLLDRRSRPGRRSIGAVAAFILLAGGAWFGAQSLTVRSWFPDHETARGERRAITLSEGSELTLDTDTALDFRSDRHRRQVTLFRGRILARVAKDAARPFVVRTRDGTATALGTAFTVRRDADATIVSVIESRVRVCPEKAEDDCADLRPGDRVRMSGGKLHRLEPVDPEAAGSWAQGWLAVDDQPLSVVLGELNRYRAVPVDYDANDLSGIRVSGSFPLGDPDRAVEGAVRSAGLRMERAPDGALRVRGAR